MTVLIIFYIKLKNNASISLLRIDKLRQAVVSSCSMPYVFTGSCDECQTNNHLRKVPSELHPVPPPDGSFRQFGMDLIGPFRETAKGNKYVVVLTDYLTKWPEAEAIPDKRASTVAEFLVKVVCRYASTEVIITDQGREFCNRVNDVICQRMGIDHRKTSAYHPQSNGLTERFNQTLINTLVKYTNEEQDNWDEYVQPALLAYRTAEHKGTKQTPFFLAFGRKPALLIEQSFPVGCPSTVSDEQTLLNNRAAVAARMVHIHEDAKERIEESQVTNKKYYDQKYKFPRYSVGDKVYINNPRRINRKGDKLTRRWTGPHVIEEIGKKGTYRVKGLKCIVNAKRMKPYRSRQPFVLKSEASKPVSVTTTTPEAKNVQDHIQKPALKLRRKAQHRVKKGTKGSRKMKSLRSTNKLSNSKLTGRRKWKAKGETPQGSDSVKIINVEQVEKIIFDPVDKEWQKRRADALKLAVREELPSTNGTVKKVSILEPPNDAVRIRGDGNCYFRTVSHILTGSQAEHRLLRKHTFNYIKKYNNKFSSFTQCSNYADVSLMNRAGQWATEIEILATATMLATNVCVYCPYGRDSAGNKIYKWVTYKPINGLPALDGLTVGDKNIYISNMSDHYTPVYSIKC